MKEEIENNIRKLLSVIPYCKTREEAEEIQKEIILLEEDLKSYNNEHTI